MPDSKLVFSFAPQPLALDFSRYPYPFFDELSLDPNQIAYLVPKTIDETWLTAVARLQASLGRMARYRPLETRLVRSVDELKPAERLIILGESKQYSDFSKLKLPLLIQPGKALKDEQGRSLGSNQGLLMMGTTVTDIPVLIATGQAKAGVEKVVQFLVQDRDRAIATGQTILVDSVTPIPTPESRQRP